MIGILRRCRDAMRERSNRALVDELGDGTRLVGVVDRRAAGARIVVGSGSLIQGRLVVERDESRLNVGDDVLVGPASVLDCALAITIEPHVLISYECIIADSDNHSLYAELRKGDLANWMSGFHDWSRSGMSPVRICSGAWIGARSIILKGVTIGSDAVVGMGSVVTRDVPPRVVVAGNPARVIREIGPVPIATESYKGSSHEL